MVPTSNFSVPVLGFVAYCSNMGKTTLLKQVISALNEKSIRVGIVKHCHHEIQIDKPGKDSYELRKAGAEQAVLASNNGWALMVEHQTPEYPKLEYLLERMDTDNLDIVLLEGFRQEDIPKIEVSRNDVDAPLLCQDSVSGASIVALVTDRKEVKDLRDDIVVLPLATPNAVVEFVLDWIDLNSLPPMR